MTNQGRAINPATNPKAYPKRGLTKIRTEAHKKINGLAIAGPSAVRALIAASNPLGIVRSV
jgi:hypothetical protein